jgi:predicted GH43/DUF377 family glycosyl hydrolase
LGKEDLVEKRLLERAQRGIKTLQGVRGPNFNPGAFLMDEKLLVFPRLIFDYYTYTSSVGMFELAIDDLLQGRIPKPLHTRILLWPTEPWEFGPGCEDPRIAMWNEEIYILYTGARQYNEDHKVWIKPVQGMAKFSSSFDLLSRGYFSIQGKDGLFTPAAKDSALLAPRNGNWSTNALPMGNDEYLVGWHGVSRDDQAYRNGLALVDGEGYVRAISDYLLVPQGLNECYGDRPHTMFGNGLVRHKDQLIWVGGVGDYAIGIFTTPIERALERLRKI